MNQKRYRKGTLRRSEVSWDEAYVKVAYGHGLRRFLVYAIAKAAGTHPTRKKPTNGATASTANRAAIADAKISSRLIDNLQLALVVG